MLGKLFTNCLACAVAIAVVFHYPTVFGLSKDIHSDFTINGSIDIHRLSRRKCPICEDLLVVKLQNKTLYYQCNACHYSISMNNAHSAIYNYYKNKLIKK